MVISREVLIGFLEELDEFLSDYADADLVGDPPKYRPNRAMDLQTEAAEILEQLLDDRNE